MSTELEGFDFGRRAVPSVGADRWFVHAQRKLASGYTLIFHPVRRSANMFMAGKGYEPIPYKIAARLIKEAQVREIGKHHLGTMYMLAENVALAALPVDDDTDVQETEEGVDLATLESEGDGQDFVDESDAVPE
jgi:hypothetical protein